MKFKLLKVLLKKYLIGLIFYKKLVLIIYHYQEQVKLYQVVRVKEFDLASQIGSGLTGVLYVLDEPSIGLHQKDNKQLIETLFKLQRFRKYNVIVVEHDEEAIKNADHIIDIGVNAGIHGGEIVAEGKFATDILRKY